MTVSFPVRRRASSRRTGATGFLTSGRAPRRGAAAGSSSSSTGTATLPAAASAATFAAAALPARSATSRRNSSSLRRCASSSERLRASSSARRRRASSSSTFRRASSSARRRASSRGAFLLLPAPIRFGESRPAGALPRRPCGHPARRGCARPLLRGQRAGNHDRAAAPARGCRPRRRLLARDRRRRLGSAGSRADPGLIARFLRTSTVTVFERPCEKLWRTCAVSTGLRSSSRPPARPRVSGRFCSCSSCSALARSRRSSRSDTIIVPRRPDRGGSALDRLPLPSESRRSFPHRRSAGCSAGRRRAPHVPHDRGRTPRRSPPPSAPPQAAGSRPSARILRAPALGAVERRQQQRRPFRRGRPRTTFSNPATARPARRASPIASQQRRASSASTRSASPAARVTGRRAARAKSRFATARSTISRRGVNHKPRPGRLAATSGTISPPGADDKAQHAARGRRISPVAMQRRCGPASRRRRPRRIARRPPRLR